MKKYTIATSVIVATLTFVSAQNYGEKPTRLEEMKQASMQKMMRSTSSPAEMGKMMEKGIMPLLGVSIMMTGDQETDAKLKALQVEMEGKIMAIRNEYQAKVKAIVGDRNGIAKPPTVGMMGSTTPRRGDARMMQGTSTEGSPSYKEGDTRKMEMQMKRPQPEMGATMDRPQPPQQQEEGFRGFFERLFGR